MQLCEEGLFSSKNADDSDAGDDDGGADGINVMVLVIVLAVVTVESMMKVVMILKHGVGALHIGLETVRNL